MAIGFENFYETTLSAPITATDTYIPLETPPATATEGWLLVDYDDADAREFIYYTSKDATGVTVASVGAGRGQDNTLASAHLQNAKVRMVVNAGMLEDTLAGVNIATDAIATAMVQDDAITPAKRSGGLVAGALTVSSTGAKSVTLGFAPQLVKVYGVITSNDVIGSHSIGTFDGTTMRCLAHVSRSSTGTSSSSRYYTNFQMNIDGPAILCRADTFAFTSTGFTYSVHTASATVTVWYEAYA